MFDYYRARFKVLTPARRPIPETNYSGPKPVPMTPALSRMCWLSWFLAGFLITVAVYVDSPPGVGFFWAWVTAQILMVPISVTLGAGLRERQTWTRPLLIGLLAFGACVLGLQGVFWFAATASIVTMAMALYLYRSEASRAYYAHLREEAVVRIAAADLRSLIFVPLYTAGIGGVLGLVLGWWLVSRHLAEDPTPGPMGANDLYAIVLAGVACGALLGTLGRLLGDAVVSRWSRRG